MGARCAGSRCCPARSGAARTGTRTRRAWWRRHSSRACAADLARRHGLHPQQLYTWRWQARRGELALLGEDAPMFAAVVEAPEPAAAPAQLHASGEVVIELGELRLRIGPEVAPARVAALVKALRSAA
jgi:transposase